MQLKTLGDSFQTGLLVEKPHRHRGEMWAAAVARVDRRTRLKMLTKVKFSDKAGLRTGAGGMPMVDAIMAYFEFSEELSFSDCKTDGVDYTTGLWVPF